MESNLVNETDVRNEFYRSTEKSHIYACWIGLSLNLVWFASDYFVLPDHFIPFLTFRLVVSILTLPMVFFRKQLGVNIYQCMFALVLGISIQNAYMWSVMDVNHFQQHAFAYLVLFIGAGMLVLWSRWYSITLVSLTIVFNVLFYEMNSDLTFKEFLINGGLLVLTVLIFCVFLIRTRYRLTYNEVRSRMVLAASKEKIESQNEALRRKNEEILDSIQYAQTIQQATIPGADRFKNYFRESFVMFQPKDVVSGDFYSVHEKDDLVIYTTGDCTGHGVPGGFMTMLGLSFMDDIVVNRGITDPAQILEILSARIIVALNQSESFGTNRDGMDISVCCLDLKSNKMVVASANNSVYIVRADSGEMEELKSTRRPVGFTHSKESFSNKEVQLNSGDMIFTSTDGYADQFGGPKGKKFRFKQFEELLQSIAPKNASDQLAILEKQNKEWKGDLEQVDDILVIGVRV